MAQGTTIAEMLTNLAESKAAIIEALKAKGVTVPDGAKFEDLAELVSQVEDNSINIDPYLVAWERNLSVDNSSEWIDLIVPEGVKRIGNGFVTSNSIIFHKFNGVTGLTFPRTLESIGDYAFGGVYLMRDMIIPSSCKTIGKYAFSAAAGGGEHLGIQIILEEGVETIGEECFVEFYCENKFTIPLSVTSIGINAFMLCVNIEITFTDRTIAEVQAMANYPWGLSSSTIHCTDGDLTV